MHGMVNARGRIALAAGSAARWSSRVTGRGAGAMIGGLVGSRLYYIVQNYSQVKHDLLGSLF